MNNIVKESARGYNILSIDSLLTSKRKIFLDEEVNSNTCSDVIKQLMYFNGESESDEIVMYINSPGGCVDSGLVVYDVMRMIKAPLRTVCVGIAASMGAILFLGGDKREMMPHSRLMIHDPSFGGGSYMGKKPHELQSEVDKLNETRKTICEIIAERTGKSIEQIEQKTVVDSYFNAAEAVEFGLATTISTTV